MAGAPRRWSPSGHILAPGLEPGFSQSKVVTGRGVDVGGGLTEQAKYWQVTSTVSGQLYGTWLFGALVDWRSRWFVGALMMSLVEAPPLILGPQEIYDSKKIRNKSRIKQKGSKYKSKNQN